ncbi:MAG TPA: zinc-binding alcohol dehydrogenase [Polyangiaceae bacterium]
MTTARSFWVTGPSRGELRDEALATPAAGEVLVETLWSGVSRGTESLVFQGRVPPSEFRRMRCPHQDGDFPWPVKYGYANVGRVAAGSPALAGAAVFCLFPHQTAYVVPESAVTRVPDGVPPRRAVLAANLETALNAVWDGAPRLGDRVTVVGAGVVGCLCAYLVGRIPGTEVELVDLNPSRGAVAAALGVGFAEPSQARLERDLVFDASGNARGAETALSVAGTDATVLELSWFGSGPVALPLGEDFHSRRLTLRSSQVGRVSPEARRRHTHRSRLELALSLLADSRLDVLLSQDSPFSSLPETMSQLSQSAGPLCQVIRY